MIIDDNETTTIHMEENKKVKAEEEMTQEAILDKCKTECEEWKDKYLHLLADFQNYKKRLVQERADWGYEAQKQIVLDILEVADDFERAFEQEKRREHSETESILAGFALIYNQLEKIVTKYGVQEIVENESFNPEYHEALVHVDSAHHATGTIVQVIQKGYRFKGHVLRPAKVSVAK